MNPNARRIVWVVSALCVVGAWAQQPPSSVCAYDPPESRVLDLMVQGAFEWYNAPSVMSEERTLSASFLAEFHALRSSATNAQQAEARAEARGSDSSWTLAVDGAGSLTTYLEEDLFGIAALGISTDTGRGAEIDLTAGVGTGRFRDVTPMARAIRVQNALLDVGQLLAPVGQARLGEMAQILGEVGPTDDDKLTRVADLLQETGLLPENDLSIRGWLAMEAALSSTEPSRLCGRDVQARLGATAVLGLDVSVSATGMLLARYAVVPDPVSQWSGDLEIRFRVARPEQMSIRGDVFYTRRIPDGWATRVGYRIEVDRRWREDDTSWVQHELTARLSTRVLGNVGLSLVGELGHQTGDDKLTLSLSLRLEADLL
jgi:hypothetical protein